MSSVTLQCDCPDSAVVVTVQRADNPADVAAAAFRNSGKKTIDLSAGDHWLAFRAVGAAHAPLTLTAGANGAMRAVSTALGEDGRAAGIRKLIVSLAVMFAVLCGAATASAQAARDTAKTDIKSSLVALPAVASPSVPGASMSIEANSTDRRGALSIVFGRAASDRFTAGLTLSGPVNDATKSAQPLDLGGLRSGASVEVGLHWFLWQGRADLGAARSMCRARFARDDCDDRDFADAADRRGYLRALGANVDPVIVDLTASVGRTTFSYLEKNTLTPGSQAHSDSSMAVALGRVTPATGLVSAGYVFSRDWKPASAAKTLCQPLGATATLECQTSPVGAPKMSASHAATLELRRFVVSRKAAVAPRVSWDVRSKVTSVSVPIYVFTNSAANLSGGIKLGWNSRNHDLTAVLFIGPVFSFFK